MSYFQPHMTMKAILDREQSRKDNIVGCRKPPKRHRPKSTKSIDVLRGLKQK